MTDNIFLFCDMSQNNSLPLGEYLDPLLARLPEEKRKLLVPNIKERPFEYVESHSIFCRFKKTCTCEKETRYDSAQFVLSDRRPVQPYTELVAMELRYRDEGWAYGDERLMDRCAHSYGMPWGSGRIWNLAWAEISTAFAPIWRQIWDTVTVTEHEHSRYGVTLWQPIGNGLYEWVHATESYDRIRLRTGLGRIAWDAEGNGRLFRVTEH